MLPLVAALALAAPWTKELHASPQPEILKLTGPRAPKGLVFVAPGVELRLTVQGPGALVVRAHVVTIKRSGEAGGALAVTLDDAAPRHVDIGGNVIKSWRMPAHPLFQLTTRKNTTIAIPPGEHHVTLTAPKNNALGIAFSASFRADADSGPAVATAEAEEPELPRDPAAAEADENEPPLAGPAAETSDPSEPDLVTGVFEALPAADPPAEMLPEPVRLAANLSVIAPAGATSAASPAGQERLWRVGAEAPLILDATGPGALRLDLRAHRAQSLPQTLEPVIIGITFDEVLLSTLTLKQEVDPSWHVQGEAFALARRVGIALPVQAGAHRIQISCSENATLGLSVAARLESEAEQAAAARSQALLAAPPSLPVPEVETAVTLSLSAGAGAWRPSELPALGVAAFVETTLALPDVASGAALGVGTGFRTAERKIAYAAPHLASGRGEITTTLSAVPIVLDLRWRESFAPLWIEVGAGGGILMGWSESRVLGERLTSDIVVRPAASAHLGAAVSLGPGDLVLRAAMLVAQPFTAPGLRDVSAGGASFTLGYRVATGG